MSRKLLAAIVLAVLSVTMGMPCPPVTAAADTAGHAGHESTMPHGPEHDGMPCCPATPSDSGAPAVAACCTVAEVLAQTELLPAFDTDLLRDGATGDRPPDSTIVTASAFAVITPPTTVTPAAHPGDPLAQSSVLLI